MLEPSRITLVILYVCLLFGALDVEAFAPSSPLNLRVIEKISTKSLRTYKFRSLGSTPTKKPSIPADVGEDATPTPVKKSIRIYNLPRTAYRIYRDYAKRLWRETNVSAREKIADDKIRGAIRSMQQVLLSNEYARLPEKSEDAKHHLIEACQNMENAIKLEIETSETEVVVAEEPILKKEKKQRSVLFGAVMGASVACWVFSGNYVFTGLFTLMTVLGQLEYYRMIMRTGVYPARRISVVGACSMFLTVRCDDTMLDL
jgi:hypothetical protein